MDFSNFWTQQVSKNADGLTAAILRLAKHDGDINYSLLTRVKSEDAGQVSIASGVRPLNKFAHLSIMIGGEVANSFSPLYEFSYFAQAWLLSAAATFVFSDSHFDIEHSKIRTKLLSATESELLNSLRSPLIAIVSNLDTDIEPCRYAKHALWRIPKESERSRCTELKNKGVDYGVENESFTAELKNYISAIDIDIALESIKWSRNLVEAKQIQYTLALQRSLSYININFFNLPFYFHKVPKEELIEAGPDTIFLKSLLEMHTRPSLSIYSKIVKRNQPWIIGKKCPNCGETSKRIINYRIKEYGRIVRGVCSAKSSHFYREDGVGTSRSGCGHVFEFSVPETTSDLYDFINQESFTINFPVRDILGVVRETVYQPAVWLVTDIGIRKTIDGKFEKHNQPTGFGDHRDMITSTIEVHDKFLSGHAATATSRFARSQKMLVNAPVEIFGNTSPVRFVDYNVIEPNSNVFVTDTSITRRVNSINDAYDALDRCCDLNHFSLTLLTNIKST